MVEVNPYERTSLIEGHLAVDGFGFAGVRVPGREVFHVRPDDRVLELLVPCKYIIIFEGEVPQGDFWIFPRPVLEVVNVIPVVENVHRAKENNILFPEACVKNHPWTGQLRRTRSGNTELFAGAPWCRPFDAYGVSGCTRP